MAMVRGIFVLTVLVVAPLGVWGCSQGNTGSQAERIRALEAKCAKLEDDYRAAATVRDQAKKKTANLEEEVAKLRDDFEAQKKQLQTERDTAKQVAKERHELRQVVEARTTERDALQTR